MHKIQTSFMDVSLRGHPYTSTNFPIFPHYNHPSPSSFDMMMQISPINLEFMDGPYTSVFEIDIATRNYQL